MTGLSAERLAEIRGRDARAQVTNDLGSRIPCAQDRRTLLAEVDRLTAELADRDAEAQNLRSEVDRWKAIAVRLDDSAEALAENARNAEVEVDRLTAEAQDLRAEMESMAVAFDRTIAVYEGQS